MILKLFLISIILLMIILLMIFLNYININEEFDLLSIDNNKLFPITYSIPEEKIVNKIPYKTKMLSDLIPGKTDTYIYNNETDYYNEYKSSYFAITQ